jgi:hypothetical protein
MSLLTLLNIYFKEIDGIERSDGGPAWGETKFRMNNTLNVLFQWHGFG